MRDIIKAILLISILAIAFRWHEKYARPAANLGQANQDMIKTALESSPLYHSIIFSAVFDCVLANYTACALEKPVDPANIFEKAGNRVVFDKNGCPFFCYKFRRTSTCTGGGIVEYSTVPVAQIDIILNETFENYCFRYGSPLVWTTSGI